MDKLKMKLEDHKNTLFQVLSDQEVEAIVDIATMMANQVLKTERARIQLELQSKRIAVVEEQVQTALVSMKKGEKGVVFITLKAMLTPTQDQLDEIQERVDKLLKDYNIKSIVFSGDTDIDIKIIKEGDIGI